MARRLEPTPAYTECKSVTKSYINTRLLPRLFAGNAANAGDVIVLDGPAMRTSLALVRHANIAAERIHIVERDEATLAIMQRRVAKARLCRPTGPLGRVNVHRGDVFRRLASLAVRGRRRVHAIVLDLMQGTVSREQQAIVADAANASDAQFVTFTFAGRPGGGLTDTVAGRVRDLQTGPLGRVFRGTAYVYGYQRSSSGGGASANMYFVAMQRRRCQTRYRPRTVSKRTSRQDGKVRVQWYGWPNAADATYERPEHVLVHQ